MIMEHRTLNSDRTYNGNVTSDCHVVLNVTTREITDVYLINPSLACYLNVLLSVLWAF